MPSFPKFPTSTQIGHGVNPTPFQESQVARAEARRQAHIEAPVGVEQGWIVPIHGQPFLMDHKHGNGRAVF